MPPLSLIKCIALALSQLTLIITIVGLANITLHLRLQSPHHILSELWRETRVICLFLLHYKLILPFLLSYCLSRSILYAYLNLVNHCNIIITFIYYSISSLTV